MGLRCSLLGHEYGEAEVEEDREERGNEVVVTVRELKRCARCGDEQVLSENTEVTSLGAETSEQGPDEPPAEQSTLVDEAEPSPSVDDEFAVGGVEDDAVIIDDDDDEEQGREHGEWPSRDEDEAVEEEPAADRGDWPDDGGAADVDEDDGDAEPAAWPEHDAEDEGFSAEPGDDEAADVEYDGLRPQGEAADEDPGTEYVESGSDAADAGGEGLSSGITSTGPVEPDAGDDVDAVLVCPECNFEEPATASSLRMGDICPDCRRGYLTQRSG